jgi:hypothetical protein
MYEYTTEHMLNQTGGVWTRLYKEDSKFSSYGELNRGTSSTYPGIRGWSVTWIDNDGVLWLYGGQGYTNVSSGSLGDVWRFNLRDRIWTWTAGIISVDTRSYPQENKPGCRRSAASSYSQCLEVVYFAAGTWFHDGSNPTDDQELWMWDMRELKFRWLETLPEDRFSRRDRRDASMCIVSDHLYICWWGCWSEY